MVELSELGDEVEVRLVILVEMPVHAASVVDWARKTRSEHDESHVEGHVWDALNRLANMDLRLAESARRDAADTWLTSFREAERSQRAQQRKQHFDEAVASARLPPQLTAAEVRARLPVWWALSEMWLDTTHTDDHLEVLAQTLAASDFGIDELGRIHRREVAPVVWNNPIYGEWAGFDLEWLTESCADAAIRQRSLRATLGRILRWPLVAFAERYWWRDFATRVQAIRDNEAP